MALPPKRGRPRTPDTSFERQEMRPEFRADDPRAAAEARAAEIMGGLGDVTEATDDFAAPAPPPGWSYEWKRRTIYNQPDPAYQRQLEQTGWAPVPTSRHPEMMPHGSKEQIIERKGMVLMERPAVITERFREIDRKNARQQVRYKEEQLAQAPQGTFERDAHQQTKPRVKHSYEPIPIPGDEK